MFETAGLMKSLRDAMHARASEGRVPADSDAKIEPGQRIAGPLRAGAAVSAADDGFHFADYADHSHKLFYVEWWYYNLVDPATGLSAMVTYAVVNPGDELGLGVASLNCAAMTPDGAETTKIDFMRSEKTFTASSTNADVTLGESFVKCLDDATYHVKAASADGGIAMDLTFERTARSQLLADNVPGYSAWEVSSWLVYMPAAKVTGTVTVDGKVHQITDAKGYHDHDWGMWMLPERIWSWAQFSSEDHRIAFDVGFHAAFQKSTAYMGVGDLDLYFPQEKFSVKQADWKTWTEFWTYPTHMTFTAVDETGKYRLELEWRVTATSTLWKYPLIVFEQAADYAGTLNEIDPESGAVIRVVETIAERGFCEFTNRWIGGHE